MGCSQAKIEPEALTPDDARIIRETWKMVGREAYGEYGQRLMLRIFQKCPDIKALWQNSRVTNNATTTTTAGDDPDAPNTANRWKMDLRNHGSKFFNSLDDLIMVVDKPEELFKMLHDIGLRHKGYEVKSEHIQAIVDGLNHTMEFGLRDKWTDARQKSFQRLINIIVSRSNRALTGNEK
jgi:hemoglobin-like flavoprotein